MATGGRQKIPKEDNPAVQIRKKNVKISGKIRQIMGNEWILVECDLHTKNAYDAIRVGSTEKTIVKVRNTGEIKVKLL